MQRVSLPFLVPGMVVASNVYSSDRRLLLSSGTTLNASNLTKIKRLGIGSVYVANPLFESLVIPEVVKEDTRQRTVQALQAVCLKFEKTGDLDIEPLKPLAKALVTEVIQNRDAMVHSLDMRTYDDYIFGHSVNVCVLSLLTALSLDYNEAKLIDLALGVLLHDLGMLAVPREILLKVGNLTKEEAEEVQKHVDTGFEALRRKRDISTPAAHIAYQHHERYDGNGYPRQLKGEEIHEYSRIATVADVFDALVSDRPYRKGMLPHEAYEILMTLGDKYVDRQILDIFSYNVAIYPVGAVVQLNTGEYAAVTKVVPKLQARPSIRLLTGKDGKILAAPVEVELVDHLTLFIKRVLKEDEVFALGRELQS
jgi:HD-GYP domain-containing protein (c-di-GMP phosphodiesterase class II)